MQLNCASGYFIWKNMETQFKLEKTTFFSTLSNDILKENYLRFSCLILF